MDLTETQRAHEALRVLGIHLCRAGELMKSDPALLDPSVVPFLAEQLQHVPALIEIARKDSLPYCASLFTSPSASPGAD